MDGSESDTNSRGNVDDVLAHYGVLGMHWGRRGRSTSTSEVDNFTVESPVQLHIRSGHGITKSRGGENRLPSDDAKQAAVYKQIARRSTTDALSNKQLSALNTRVGMEQSYRKAMGQTNTKSIGRKFLDGLWKQEGKPMLIGTRGPLNKFIAGVLNPAEPKAKVAGKVAVAAVTSLGSRSKYAPSGSYKVRRSTASEMG